MAKIFVPKYWRVITFGGCDGSVQDTPDEAWKSHYRAMEKFYGSDWQSSSAAHTPRLVGADTRRAAKEADISLGGEVVGEGEWRLHDGKGY